MSTTEKSQEFLGKTLKSQEDDTIATQPDDYGDKSPRNNGNSSIYSSSSTSSSDESLTDDSSSSKDSQGRQEGTNSIVNVIDEVGNHASKQPRICFEKKQR